jgi:hypothetical protein
MNNFISIDQLLMDHSKNNIIDLKKLNNSLSKSWKSKIENIVTDANTRLFHVFNSRNVRFLHQNTLHLTNTSMKNGYTYAKDTLNNNEVYNLLNKLINDSKYSINNELYESEFNMDKTYEKLIVYLILLADSYKLTCLNNYDLKTNSHNNNHFIKKDDIKIENPMYEKFLENEKFLVSHMLKNLKTKNINDLKNFSVNNYISQHQTNMNNDNEKDNVETMMKNNETQSLDYITNGTNSEENWRNEYFIKSFYHTHRLNSFFESYVISNREMYQIEDMVRVINKFIEYKWEEKIKNNENKSKNKNSKSCVSRFLKIKI